MSCPSSSFLGSLAAKGHASFYTGVFSESLPIFSAAAVFVAALLVLVTGGCSPRPTPMMTFSGETMGTFYTVKVADPPVTFDRAAVDREILLILDEINASMSTYQEDSEIARFNRFDRTEWFPVSQQTARVIGEAIKIGRLTDGAFDITVGPLVNLWNFGPERRAVDSVPQEAEIERLRARIGLGNLEVRDSPPGVRKMIAELEVDLSGIAKGFAVDRVAEHLRSAGAANYMVEVGGDMRAMGRNREGNPWRIGVESPIPEARVIQRVIPLTNTAMATSGDYRNSFEQDGVRYSHIISSITGRPISHQLASVTVISATCMRADGLATALMVLGPDAGYELALREGLSCLFIVKDRAGFIEKKTPGFEDLLR